MPTTPAAGCGCRSFPVDVPGDDGPRSDTVGPVLIDRLAQAAALVCLLVLVVPRGLEEGFSRPDLEAVLDEHFLVSAETVGVFPG